MQVPFVDLVSEHRPILAEIDAAISSIVAKADFVLGSEVERFEEEFAAFCESSYAVGVDSGLSAIKLLLEAMGVGPGDEVLLPTNSFVATAAAVSQVGATPVLVDIDPLTNNLDISAVEALINERTRAVIPVHLYGLPVDMSRLMQVANSHGLFVIEDAAQAHGARLNGRRTGSLGHAAAFSFYPTKNLGAFGDAGMAVTSDAEVAQRVKYLRNCGQTKKYVHEYTPYNHRLDSLQAAVLRVKLPHLDAANEARRMVADSYTRALKGLDVAMFKPIEGAEPVWHLFAIRTGSRDALAEHLRSHGVGTSIHYPIPIHLQPYYRHLGYERGAFPVAETYADTVLSLPMYPTLKEDAVDYVVQHIAEFQANAANPVGAVGRAAERGDR